MAKYIRKPVIVDAVQWFPEVGRSLQDVYPAEDGQHAIVYDGHEHITVDPGDWCVRGPDLQVKVYRPEEFQRLFEEVFPGYKERQNGR